MRLFEPLKHTKHGTTWLDWMFSTNDMSHSTGFDTGTTSNNRYIFLQKMKTNDGNMLTEPVLERRKIRNCWEFVYVDKIFWQWNPGPQLCAFFQFFQCIQSRKCGVCFRFYAFQPHKHSHTVLLPFFFPKWAQRLFNYY